MAANSVGQVTVEIIADASKFEKGLVTGVDNATKKAEAPAEKGGNKIGDALGRGIAFTAKSAGAIIVAGLTATLAKGFGRLNAIDQAEAKLKGLGNTTEEVAGIMDDALEAVVGTAFGLDEAATLAASFMAVNVEAGDELTRVLKITADAATIANTSMADMGDVFVDVAAAGKLTGDELNRLSDRGIDALGALQKHYGITREEAQKMVTDGEVSFEEFADAMETSLGSAAGVETLIGNLRNVGAAMGRLGANILRPFFNGLKAILPTVIEAIDAFGLAFKTIFEEIGPTVQKAFDIIAGALSSINWAAIGELVVGMAQAIWNGIKLVIAVIKEWIESMQPALTNILTAVRDALLAIPWEEVIGFIQRITPAVVAAVGAFLAFQKVQKVIKTLTAVMTGLQGVIIGITWATKGHSAALHRNTTAVKVNAAGLKIHGVVTKIAGAATKVFGVVTGLLTGKLTIQTVATKIATAAQRAFNAAMKANPIGLVITAIVALVAALTLFFTKTEIGRQIWATFVEFLTSTWAAFVAWFQPILQALAEFFAQVWQTMVTIVTTIWEAFMGWIMPIIEVFVEHWKAQWERVKDIIEKVWMVIQHVILPIVQGIFDFIRQAVQAFVDFWGPIWDVVKGIVQTVWDVIKGIIDLAVAIIVGIFTGDFSSIVGIIDGIWQSVRSGVESAWDGIIAWIKTVPQKIKDIFSGAISWLFEAGQNILQGLWNGLKSIWSNIENWFTNKIDGLVSKAQDLLKIGSPSKVFHEMGQQVAQGFINGVDSLADDITATANVFAQPAKSLTAGPNSILGPVVAAASEPVVSGGNTFSEGAIQVNGAGDPYKAALLTVNSIAERVAL